MATTITRRPSEAPSAIRDARIVAMLVLGLAILGCIATAGLVVTGLTRDVPTTMILFGFYALFAGLHVWLLGALKRGESAAWSVQIPVAILGLLGFPLGTLIYGILLFKWFKPETKARFGVL